MPLPKIDMPIYQCELPSTKEKVSFRTFTVKEEKILLTAQESKESGQIMLSIQQVLNNCLLDRTIDGLAIFDIEYLLVQIRSKSVDNKAEFDIVDPDTEETITLEVDLSNMIVQRSADHTNRIAVSDQYTLFLKYPTLEQFETLISNGGQSTESSYNLMLACVDKLASQEEVFEFKDFPEEEVHSFIEDLQSDSVKEIKKFFDTMPRIRHEVPYKNSKGASKTFVLEGTQTFFI